MSFIAKLWVLLVLVCIFILSSCSTSQKVTDLDKKIKAQDAMSWEQIRLDTNMVLEAHDELTVDVKEQIRNLIYDTFKTHQALKDEEAIIVHMLLELNINSQKNENQKYKQELEMKLNQVYKNKASNMLSLLDKISKMNVDIEFNNHIERLIREVR